MFFLYSILLTVGFVLLLPRFIFDAIFNGKYAGGFAQRMGFVPRPDRGKPVVWVHCVSVGETNAARPLIDRIRSEYPDFSIVVSTTTATGQKLAKTLFDDIADLVFYFPFDWRSTVRRTLKRISPSIVLIVETEIWFNFFRETVKSDSRLAIVNGRLSERSFRRFRYITSFMHRILSYVDLALMQGKADAKRIMALGLRGSKVRVTGNIKFDHEISVSEASLTLELGKRFGIRGDAPLILAASTHSPEEEWILEACKDVWKSSPDRLPRLMIAPRHPDRFPVVAESIRKSGFTWVRRSEKESARDKTAEVILLDSIGELRSAYSLAEIVFVGGSLVPHGGQSVFEPAAAARAIVTGPHTSNFAEAVAELVANDALIQLPVVPEKSVVQKLATAFAELLQDEIKRTELGTNALGVIESNRGATSRTFGYLAPLFDAKRKR